MSAKTVLTTIMNILFFIVGLSFSYIGLFVNKNHWIAIIGGLLILVSRVHIIIVLSQSGKVKVPKVIWEK